MKKLNYMGLDNLQKHKIKILELIKVDFKGINYVAIAKI